MSMNSFIKLNTNPIYVLALIFVFLSVFIESVSLFFQLKGKKLTKWLGKNAFTIHALITGGLWLITLCFIIILQFEMHPKFHSKTILKYAGLILMGIGIILASWAFKILGLKRALCVNFFSDNVTVVRTSLYKYIKNPMDIGFWTALFSFSLYTDSLYNFIIASEFMIIMIPHMMLENIKLKPKVFK